MQDKNKMVVHCGGKVVDLEALEQYEMPEATSSYHPIGHFQLAEYIKSTSTELLQQPPIRESYAVTKEGARMFGLQVFGDPDEKKCEACGASGSVMTADGVKIACPRCNGTGWAPGNEYGFGVAFRNSYDKSMSVGIAAGFSVFICDNLAVCGEIKILRKHTKNVWGDIDQTLVHTLFRKRPQLERQFAEDVDFLKNRPIKLQDGYRLLGLLMGEKILAATQAGVAMHNWNQHGLEGPANGWNFYNDCTQALKSSPPHQVLERHLKLHDYVRAELS